MKTYRVVHVLELESFVNADSEEEALLTAREGLLAFEEGSVVIEERADVWNEGDTEPDPNE